LDTHDLCAPMALYDTLKPLSTLPTRVESYATVAQA
jgi:hypothetical protein